MQHIDAQDGNHRNCGDHIDVDVIILHCFSAGISGGVLRNLVEPQICAQGVSCIRPVIFRHLQKILPDRNNQIPVFWNADALFHFCQCAFSGIRRNNGADQQTLIRITVQNPEVAVFANHAAQGIGSLNGNFIILVRKLEPDGNFLTQCIIISQCAQGIRFQGNFVVFRREFTCFNPDAAKINEGLIHRAEGDHT